MSSAAAWEPGPAAAAGGGSTSPLAPQPSPPAAAPSTGANSGAGMGTAVSRSGVRCHYNRLCSQCTWMLRPSGPVRC